jgi:hypothetical protein
MEQKGIKVFFLKDDKTFMRLLYFMIAFIPAMFLLSFIHELGHLLYALIRGWEVIEFKVFLLPFSFEVDSYIYVYYDPVNELDYVLFAISGSLHTLIWGYIFFILFYKFELPKFLEATFFLYSLMLIFDMLFYMLVDIFILQYGDWYRVYITIPELTFFFMCFAIINLLLFIRYFEEITEEVDI